MKWSSFWLVLVLCSGCAGPTETHSTSHVTGDTTTFAIGDCHLRDVGGRYAIAGCPRPIGNVSHQQPRLASLALHNVTGVRVDSVVPASLPFSLSMTVKHPDGRIETFERRFVGGQAVNGSSEFDQGNMTFESSFVVATCDVSEIAVELGPTQTDAGSHFVAIFATADVDHARASGSASCNGYFGDP